MNAAEEMVSEVHRIELPSRGLLYDGALPNGEIRLRPMTTREEKLLLSTRGAPESLTYDVLQSCIVEEDRRKLAVDRYLIGDVIFGFLMLRAVTYGPDYKFETSCRGCQAVIPVEVTIPHSLGVYILEDGFKEPFTVELPKSGRHIDLRLFRVADERAVGAYTRRQRSTGLDAAHSYRITRHIAAIDGEEATDLRTTEQFVDSLHVVDTETIRDAIIDNDCGVDLQMDRACVACGRSNSVFFEFTPDFFRAKPASLRGRRGTLR